MSQMNFFLFFVLIKKVFFFLCRLLFKINSSLRQQIILVQIAAKSFVKEEDGCSLIVMFWRR